MKRKKQQPQKPKGPKTIPTSINIAGGITLKAMPFVIVAYNDDGSPKTFELRPAGVSHDMTMDGACVLFAQEDWIRAPQASKTVYAREYAAAAEKMLKDKPDLTEHERIILEQEVEDIRAGRLGLTGPETVEARLERLNDHFP